jgi:hypothetical protein
MPNWRDLLIDARKDAEYTEEHAHHKVRWFGRKNPQGATDWAAPFSTDMTRLYRCISGANTWGAGVGDEALLFGTTDIPISGMVVGDFDEILVLANSSSTVYLLRIIWGTGTMADAIAAGQYTEIPYFRATADTTRLRMICPTPLIGSAYALWAQCMNATDNATIDFIVGVHGYDF